MMQSFLGVSSIYFGFTSAVIEKVALVFCTRCTSFFVFLCCVRIDRMCSTHDFAHVVRCMLCVLQ